MNKGVIVLPVTMVQVHNFTVWLAPIGCAQRPAPWGVLVLGGVAIGWSRVTPGWVPEEMGCMTCSAPKSLHTQYIVDQA
jgi:hypothetical protein